MATNLRDFKFSRDYKLIHWGGTIQYNLLRAACAGLIFGLILGFSEGKWDNMLLVIGCPVIWLIFLPIGLIAAKLSEKGVPWVGLLTWPPALMVLPGDPLVWIISMFAPRVVGMEKPPFMNFNLMSWVLKNDENEEIVGNIKEL